MQVVITHIRVEREIFYDSACAILLTGYSSFTTAGPLMACDFGARETRQLCQRLSARLKPQGSPLPFIYEFFATENVKQLSPLLLALLSILRSPRHAAQTPVMLRVVAASRK